MKLVNLFRMRIKMYTPVVDERIRAILGLNDPKYPNLTLNGYLDVREKFNPAKDSFDYVTSLIRTKPDYKKGM